MANGENANQQEQPRNADAEHPFPPGPAPLASDPNQPRGNQINEESDSNPERADPWFRNPDWYMVGLTAFLFAVGVYTAVVFHRQFKEMAKQTKILNDGATQAAADAREAATKVERQLKIADTQAKAAQASVKAIQRQMREDQRPWIKPTYQQAPTIAANQPLAYNVRLESSGKTPATKVGVTAIVVIVNNTKGAEPDFDALDAWQAFS